MLVRQSSPDNEANSMFKVNCDIEECNSVDGDHENKTSELAKGVSISYIINNVKVEAKASKNVDLGDGKAGTKGTEDKHREKEIGRYKGQPKTDLEGTNPTSNISGFQISISGFPVTWRLPDILHQAVFL